VAVTLAPAQLSVPSLSTRPPPANATQALLTAVPVPVSIAPTVMLGAEALAFRPVARVHVHGLGPTTGNGSQVHPVSPF
jgi:hypothetical protein